MRIRIALCCESTHCWHRRSTTACPHHLRGLHVRRSLLRRLRAKISSTHVVGVVVNAVTSSAIRSDRRIALIKPAVAEQDRAALAMKLLDSVLWVFKGTTQSNWIVSPAEAAQVIVVHQDEPAGHIARWRNEGKLILVISTDSTASLISPYALCYPCPTVLVLRILDNWMPNWIPAPRRNVPVRTPRATTTIQIIVAAAIAIPTMRGVSSTPCARCVWSIAPTRGSSVRARAGRWCGCEETVVVTAATPRQHERSGRGRAVSTD